MASTVVAHQEQMHSIHATGRKKASSAHMKQAKIKKSDRKWICPECQGDVRLPPPSFKAGANAARILGNDGGSAHSTKSDGKINQEEESVNETLGLTTVMCALKCCPAPRYHLKCSGVPMGSQIFRTAILTCQASTNRAVVTNTSPAYSKYDSGNAVLKHLYASSASAWWGLSPGINTVMDGNPRSQCALHNDKNWTTSMESFMCRNCNVEGQSRYLLEYFERFRLMKASFYEEYLGKSSNNGDVGNRLDRADESVEARTGEAFLWHLIQGNQQDNLTQRKAESKSTDWNPSEIQLTNMARCLTILSKSLQQQQMQEHRRRQKRQKNKFQLDPSYLVGMPIRLFNPIDKTYHSGRVLDYKVNAPYKVDQSKPSASAPNFGQLTDEKICSTLFLIRFRHGVEGREIAVHQWIYLEEHAIAIGGEVCWAKVGNHEKDLQARSSKKGDNGGNLKTAGCGTHGLKPNIMLQDQQEDYASQYRPVQIIFRSMLEMIPVQNLNPHLSCTDNVKSCTNTRIGEYMNGNSCLNVLAMGFGQAFSHVRISLGGSGRKMAKNEHNESEAAAAIAEPGRPDAIPLTSSNPSWIDRILHRAQLSDDDVAISLAMACMEKEEERRIRTWLNLSVSHLSQPTFTKRNCAVTHITSPSTASSTKSKKPRIECITPSTNSLPKMKNLHHVVSIETAASLGCPKCMQEIKTGLKKKGVHHESCPRKRSSYKIDGNPVSLEVAASLGCQKCMKEVNTGTKSKGSHDENCPRRRNFSYPLNDDEAEGSLPIHIRNTPDNLPSSGLKHKRKKQNGPSPMPSRAVTTTKQ